MRSATDKRRLLDAIIALLDAQIAQVKARAQATAEEAVHEESRPENDKDTRGLETSYLAHGQAVRAAELETDRAALRNMPLREFDEHSAISQSAWVQLERDDGAGKSVLLVARGGGLSLSFEGSEVSLVTPQSPLGRAMLGKRRDDTFEIALRENMVGYCVVEIF